MKQTIEVDDGVIPAGYRAVRFGIPIDQENFLSALDNNGVLVAGCNFGYPRLILEKVVTWRPARIDDIGKNLPCRVRDSASMSWGTNRILRGIMMGSEHLFWCTDFKHHWRICEVQNDPDPIKLQVDLPPKPLQCTGEK